MFRLPTTQSELNHLFDAGELERPYDISTFSKAKAGANTLFRGGRDAWINSIVLRANNEVWLISFDPRGGWKRLWNFGSAR